MRLVAIKYITRTTMTIYDISWPISASMTTYKDKGGVVIRTCKTIENDAVYETVLECGSHTGTHVDAPAHFIKDGIPIEKIPLEHLIGPALVIDLQHTEGGIEASDLQSHAIMPGDIVMFKTKNSARSATDPFDY